MLFIFTSAFTQDDKNLKIDFEEIKRTCKDRPTNERIRVAVTRFSMATGYRSTYKASQELGGNMSTMLTNALYEVDCFKVLEILANNEDLTGELDFGNSEYANSSKTGSKGKQLGAQVILTGEITEYTEQKKSVGVSIVNVGKQVVKLGFVIKMIDPETRNQIWSKAVNVEGKAKKSTSVGTRWFKLRGSTNDNPALSNALENGIFRAIELLMKDLGELDLPEGADPNQALTKIVISNTNYSQIHTLQNTVSQIYDVSSVEKGLDGDTGILTVVHKGNSEDLMDALYNAISKQYEVPGVADSRIDMSSK